MTTPDAHAPSGPGSAALGVSIVHGLSTATTSWARTPLKILTPRARGESVWAYTSSFGGGMVAGDRTRLEVNIDAGARCFLGTQASTKIYRNPARLPCSHEVKATIADDALLILAADPVQCFAESIYEQRQHFDLSATGNLLLIDWMTAGRAARGELWHFHRYLSRNEVQRGGKKIIIDALLLDAADGALAGKYRGGRFQCLATVALFGPCLSDHAKAILEWCAAQPIQPNAPVIFAASPCHEGAIVRFAGVSVEHVGMAIRERLGFVRELLDDDPWARKW
jgi:urease accessory protein